MPDVVNVGVLLGIEPKAPTKHGNCCRQRKVGVRFKNLAEPELVLVDGAGNFALAHRTIDGVAVRESLEVDRDAIFWVPH